MVYLYFFMWKIDDHCLINDVFIGMVIARMITNVSGILETLLFYREVSFQHMTTSEELRYIICTYHFN